MTVAAVASPTSEWRASLPPLAIVLAVAAVALGGGGFALGTEDDLRAADTIRLALLVGWAAGGVVAARVPGTRALGLVVAGGTMLGGARSLADALLERGEWTEVAEAIEALAGAGVIAVGATLLVGLPSGRLVTRSQRVQVAVIGVVALAAATVRIGAGPDAPVWPLVVLAAVAAAIAAPGARRRYEESRAVERQRLQWLGLAVALVLETALIVIALDLLLAWPPHPQEVLATSLLLIAGALVAGSTRGLVGKVETLLQHAVSLAGISALVVTTYLVIVVGLGRVPTDDERNILVLSMVAAAVAALLFVPTRSRLEEVANRLVYGESNDPGEALETFGQRLTRALPMDELLLQLVELLKKHLGLLGAEVWSGTGDRFERSASVPDRGAATIVIGDAERPVVARAGVTGRAWAGIWLPSILEERGDGPLRVVPMTSQGEVFGIIVVERAVHEDDFTDEDERVLTELARQVGLALKNSSLDLALQASLEEVKQANVGLRESRARIVAAADFERRKIERNLHDGAQQHLVALAVKLRLVEKIAENDVGAALSMLEEARTDVQATVEELRSLAHGIYPPLLMDKGLPEALRAAAGRAVLPVSVGADGFDRFSQEVEAAVYFCCLEALQNAGKHAGEGSSVSVFVEERAGELCFEVADDGAGFDLDERRAGGGLGHGFVNMADRLGAIGGTLDVVSAPGQGTRIVGRLPVDGTR